MPYSTSLDAPPLSGNARGIADSFETPEWYLKRFAANIRIRAETVATLTNGLAFRRILDIGCGDGSLSLPLLARTGRITFLDQSGAMLSRVAQRVDLRAAPIVDFFNSAFMDARLPPGGFDLVLCVGVLAYVRDPEPFLARVAAMLQPGGRLILECTDAGHGVSRLDRAYQSLTSLVRPRPFNTHPHLRRDVVSLAEAQGLRLTASFQYAYSLPVLSRFVSQKRTHRLIRRIFGTLGANRHASWGNQCLFCFGKA